MKRLVPCISFLLLILASTVFAAVPQLISYQGIVTNTSDQPIDGTHDLTFKIYPDSLQGTSALWTEVHTDVPIEKGLFSVLLGGVTPFPSDLFDADERWIGITVDTDPEIDPRVRIGSVPWALRASVAETALTTLSDGVWETVGTNIYYNNGNVGIGTDSPESFLHLRTGDGAAFQSLKIDSDGESTDYPIRIRAKTNPSAGFSDADTKFYINGEGDVFLPNTMMSDANPERFEVRPQNGRMILWDNVSSMRFEIYHGNNDLDIALRAGGVTSWINGVNDGNVGIGTTSPTEQLDVDGTVRMTGFKMPTGAANGYVLASDASGVGTWQSLSGVTDSDWTVAGDDMYSGVTGNVGVGTVMPGAKLEVLTTTGTGIVGKSTLGTGVYGENTTSGNYAYLGGSAYAVRGSGDVLFEDGTVSVPVLVITGGADLSEQFEIHEAEDNPMPTTGMVVSIDHERPGHLVVSEHAYDRKVAGIISGAGGVKTGMRMGMEGSEADGSTPVALTGRVYCWADASAEPIQPGDLLTTSDTPGHAMKVTDHGRAQGAILGKAMSSLESGKGLVLVLVALQ
jgi:hypothetical protein